MSQQDISCGQVTLDKKNIYEGFIDILAIDFYYSISYIIDWKTDDISKEKLQDNKVEAVWDPSGKRCYFHKDIKQLWLIH